MAIINFSIDIANKGVKTLCLLFLILLSNLSFGQKVWTDKDDLAGDIKGTGILLMDTGLLILACVLAFNLVTIVGRVNSGDQQLTKDIGTWAKAILFIFVAYYFIKKILL